MRKLLTSREESEWLVRVTLQLFHLAESAFAGNEQEYERFKTSLMTLVTVLRECRDAQLELVRLIETHTEELETGDIARIVNCKIELHKDIEPTLNRCFKTFIYSARTVLNHLYGQKDALTYQILGRRIDFVQVKADDKFNEQAKAFLVADPSSKAKQLMDLLRDDRRTWTNVLIATRNRMDHDVHCPTLLMNYEIIAGRVRAGFPTVTQQELRAHLNQLWSNLYQAVEETVALCLSMRMPEDVVLCRIPDAHVNPTLPFRWTLLQR